MHAKMTEGGVPDIVSVEVRATDIERVDRGVPVVAPLVTRSLIGAVVISPASVATHHSPVFRQETKY
ncbi:hypothetical protein QTN93_11310 [Sphingomonas aerolata]|uniref:hypothetical protein n=1 Tax=Sphingomonas aerolata TaxID=185951 RepID=UPI0035A5E654